MSKRREMTDAEWEAYRKAHPYEDIVEAEQSKIRRGRTGCARHRSRSRSLVRRRLHCLVAGAELSADSESATPDEDAALANEEFAAERTRRNVRTRKRRLRLLKKRLGE